LAAPASNSFSIAPKSVRNIKLVVEYDGTDFAGWQRQDNAPTIQGAIELALATIVQETVSLVGAGRTDAGVHARGQVANFRTESTLEPLALQRGLNALLPDTIAVRDVEAVPMEFHSRYSATSREYSYTIVRRRSPLSRLHAWCLTYPLDLNVMQFASGTIVGEHDFASFCRTASEVGHHRCIVTTAAWESSDDTFRFRIRANRFLHGMVRALVGTMVDVGRGYTGLEEFQHILDKRDRTVAGMAAPARGLVLEEVYY
jgi:tRNA pseudouridine38-40 synthase